MTLGCVAQVYGWRDLVIFHIKYIIPPKIQMFLAFILFIPSPTLLLYFDKSKDNQITKFVKMNNGKKYA